MTWSEIDLRAAAERIWRAGVAAVAPDRLIGEQVVVTGDVLRVGAESVDLRGVGRIAIVGGGKAAGAMAVALEAVLGPRLLADKNVTGWVNVPADCVVPTARVKLHGARPAGVNEPRPEGIEGTRRILEIVSSLGSNDLCICVITGGGSALLPAPAPGITLDDKVRITRAMSAAGANIAQLNTVRSQLSLVKGGGLARACRAGRMISLIISDVLGDPLDMIASGPTVPSSTTSADALAVIDQLGLMNKRELGAVVEKLREGGQEPDGRPVAKDFGPVSHVANLKIGNNATAVEAAGVEAERLGYSPAMVTATAPEGAAEEVGRHLAETALRMRDEGEADCLISGGEPTVMLIEESLRGKGGRNQQLALAGLTVLGACRGVALLAGGTDGEDGPTDAAGAVVTAEVADAAFGQQLDPHDYLRRNDAYHFFLSTGGLFVTGPTQTNVCDLRVVLVDRQSTR